MDNRNQTASWETVLGAFDAVKPEALTPDQHTAVAMAIFDACGGFPFRDPKLARYKDDVRNELFVLVFEQYSKYDPARAVNDSAEDGALVRYVRMLMGHKIHEVRAKMYRDLNLDGTMGMTDISAVTDETGKPLRDEATGKALVRPKYSRDTAGQTIDSFSLNATLDDDGAELESLIADPGEDPSVSLEREADCDGLWNIVLAVIEDFESYTGTTGRKKGMFYGMCLTERMVWCALDGGMEFQTPAAWKYEKYILRGLNRDYLGFFSTCREEDPLDLQGLCALTLKPLNRILEDSDSYEPVRFSRECWLPAKVPQRYLLLRTGAAPVASEIKRRRENFFLEFQKKRNERL